MDLLNISSYVWNYQIWFLSSLRQEMQQLNNSFARLRQKDTGAMQIPRCLFHLRKRSMCHVSHSHEALRIEEKWLILQEVNWEKKEWNVFFAAYTTMENVSWVKLN